MAALPDLIKSALDPVYGPDNVGAMLRKFYLAELGTAHPTQAQIRTLIGASPGQPFNDALIAFFTVGIGEFSFNFATLPDSDSLPSPWVDVHNLGALPSGEAWTYASEHDKMGIRSGGIAIVEYTNTPAGTDPPSGYDVAGSGLRATAYVPTSYTDDLYVKGTWPGVHLRQGALAVMIDPAEPLLGIGFFYDHATPLWNAYELFYLGAESGEFAWLDFTRVSHVDGTPVELELRVKDNMVAGYADGIIRCGPVPVPAELQGASKHGVHIDLLAATHVNLPCLTDFEVGEFAGTIDDYDTATILSATTAEVTTNNTLAINYPADILAGDLLLLIVGSTQTGTLSATGFTVTGANGTIAGVAQLGTLRKVAAGTESGSINVAKTGTVGHMAGVMLHIRGQHADSGQNPVSAAHTANSSASTNLTAPSRNILGMHRLGIWAGVVPSNTAITKPTDWTDVAATGTGDSAINLLVAKRDWNSIQPPYGRGSGIATGTQVGTIGASSASVGGHYTVAPEPA